MPLMQITDQSVSDAADNLLAFYLSGASECSPHPLFDRQFYLNRYTQAEASAIDPLVHY